jgi:hypothetical protein
LFLVLRVLHSCVGHRERSPLVDENPVTFVSRDILKIRRQIVIVREIGEIVRREVGSVAISEVKIHARLGFRGLSLVVNVSNDMIWHGEGGVGLVTTSEGTAGF